MKIEMGWAYGMHGRKEGWIQGLVERPDGKIPLGRPCCKGNDNIKMGVKEVGLGDVDWIELERNDHFPRKDSVSLRYQ